MTDSQMDSRRERIRELIELKRETIDRLENTIASVTEDMEEEMARGCAYSPNNPYDPIICECDDKITELKEEIKELEEEDMELENILGKHEKAFLNGHYGYGKQ